MSRSKNTLKRDIGHPEEGTGFEGEFDHQSLDFMTQYTQLKYRPFQRGLELKREFDHGQISEATGENH